VTESGFSFVTVAVVAMAFVGAVVVAATKLKPNRGSVGVFGEHPADPTTNTTIAPTNLRIRASRAEL
jgi:hypothetical protein